MAIVKIVATCQHAYNQNKGDNKGDLFLKSFLLQYCKNSSM